MILLWFFEEQNSNNEEKTEGDYIKAHSMSSTLHIAKGKELRKFLFLQYVHHILRIFVKDIVHRAFLLLSICCLVEKIVK